MLNKEMLIITSPANVISISCITAPLGWPPYVIDSQGRKYALWLESDFSYPVVSLLASVGERFELLLEVAGERLPMFLKEGSYGVHQEGMFLVVDFLPARAYVSAW